MSRQPKLRPKSHIPGYPNAFYDLAALSYPEFRLGGEEKHDQRVFRVKRKHVLKACDRCRVKKTKCDGKQPCNRCSANNHPCLFRERKATQTKVYSRGFVEMLESHHSLVVKALQRLYKLCLNKEGFPGEPLVEAPDGYPLTHAILDRLGLIKQAEENQEEPDEETEDLRYLRLLSTSTDCSVTTDPSPEPATPPGPSPTHCSPVNLSPGGGDSWKWEFQPVQTVPPDQYHRYPNYGFHGTPTHRPSLEPTNLPSESACVETTPAVPSLHHPYIYYSDSYNGRVKNRLADIVTAGPGSHQATSTAGIPVEVRNYNLHLQEQQPMYPTLAPGWTYPCG